MSETLEFPDLVWKNKLILPALEVSVDFLPEQYRGKLRQVISEFAVKWVEEKAFKKSATIWMWGCISGNLISRHPEYPVPSWSEFIVQFGLPSQFIYDLEIVLRSKLNEQASVTEQHMFQRDDGWTAICHLERGRAWMEIDGDVWSSVERSVVKTRLK